MKGKEGGKKWGKIWCIYQGQQQACGIIMDGLILKTFTQPGEDTRRLNRTLQLLTAHPAALPRTQGLLCWNSQRKNAERLRKAGRLRNRGGFLSLNIHRIVCAVVHMHGCALYLYLHNRNSPGDFLCWMPGKLNYSQSAKSAIHGKKIYASFYHHYIIAGRERRPIASAGVQGVACKYWHSWVKFQFQSFPDTLAPS